MIGIGPYLRPRAIVGGFDPDAQAFLSAAGITGSTEAAAVNTLVTDLKSSNIWSKMKALYPFVTDNRNLLSYTEDFGNVAWSKVYSNITTNTTTAPDGTLTADTLTQTSTDGRVQQTVSTTQNTVTASVYVKAPTALIGKKTLLILWRDSNQETTGAQYTLNGDWQRFTITQTFATTPTNVTFRIDGIDDGTTNDFVYLWGAQLEIGSSATTYQPIATTQQSYISSQFKYNLKDPRDLDAAFRLVFNGGWTHSSTGATPNGTNGYANTYLNPVANSLTTASAHLCYYARTAATTSDPAEIANYSSITEAFVLQSKSSAGTNRYFYSLSLGASRSVATAPTGLMMGSSVANTRRDLYHNGVSVANNTSTDTGTLANYNLYLGAGNINNSSIASYTNSQCAFASIGQGLTSTEAYNFYTAVQAFQTSLSRQV